METVGQIGDRLVRVRWQGAKRADEEISMCRSGIQGVLRGWELGAEDRNLHITNTILPTKGDVSAIVRSHGASRPGQDRRLCGNGLR